MVWYLCYSLCTSQVEGIVRTLSPNDKVLISLKPNAVQIFGTLSVLLFKVNTGWVILLLPNRHVF